LREGGATKKEGIGVGSKMRREKRETHKQRERGKKYMNFKVIKGSKKKSRI